MDLIPPPITVIDDDTMATATAANVPSAESVVAYLSSYIDERRIIKRKSANESLATNTTLQDDDDLTFPIAASEEWIVNFVIAYNAPTAGDIKIAWTVPAGATLRWTASGLVSSTTSNVGDLVSLDTTVSGTSQNFGGSGATSEIRGTLRVANSTTAGNVTLQWAQAAASGTTTVATGTHLIAERVSPL